MNIHQLNQHLEAGTISADALGHRIAGHGPGPASTPAEMIDEIALQTIIEHDAGGDERFDAVLGADDFVIENKPFVLVGSQRCARCDKITGFMLQGGVLKSVILGVDGGVLVASAERCSG